MTKEEILKRVKKFQGANREFSQELPPIIEGLVDLIDEAGPEVVNNLTSNSPTKALSANMGKELKLMVDGKVSEPETAGTAGQILQLDENGDPEWVEAAAVGATYDSAVSDTSTNAIQNKTIKKYVDDNFAQKDGYYGSLTAGAAENLVGRGSVPAEIAFRTSGGDQDLGTGTAQITKILGRTEAFNQLVRNGNFADTSIWDTQYSAALTVNSNVGTLTLNAQYGAIKQTSPLVAGHAYLFAVTYKTATSRFILGIGQYNSVGSRKTLTATADGAWHTDSIVWSGTDTAIITGDKDIFVGNRDESSGSIDLKNIILVDLTLEGLGLTTADQFRALHPLPYYNYNAGVLKNNAATGLETVGFNQWDEEWEVGSIDVTTGEKIGAFGWIRSKNFIPCIPNTTYYFKHPLYSFGIRWYDAAQNYIGYVPSSQSSAANTSPSNCAFMLITMQGTTYNHDICINLSWSGYRNGEYEPYEKHTLALPLNAIACHDEDDNAVVVNGLDGVGNVYDEAVVENGMVTKIIKRFAEVDLGDLEWSYSDSVFNAEISDAKMGTFDTAGNGVCSKYLNESWANMSDKTFSLFFAYQSGINIKDTAYSDAAAFKTAMAGVKFRYELATPITLTVDEPFAASYYVNDFGTEARLPQDTADDPQAPFCAEIQYAMNATDTLRRLPSQYISDESMTNILTALKTAGIIADFTLTYDSEHQYFTCSVTAPSQGE